MTTAPEHDKQYALPLGNAVVIGRGDRRERRDSSAADPGLGPSSEPLRPARRTAGRHASLQITEKLFGLPARIPSHAEFRKPSPTFELVGPRNRVGKTAIGRRMNGCHHRSSASRRSQRSYHRARARRSVN